MTWTAEPLRPGDSEIAYAMPSPTGFACGTLVELGWCEYHGKAEGSLILLCNRPGDLVNAGGGYVYL